MVEKGDVINNDQEVVRLTHLLSAAAKFSNITQREIERKLGLSSGSLSRLFSGGIELKLKHVLDICDVIGFSPARFFSAAFPHPPADRNPDAQRLERLLTQLHPDMYATQPPTAEPQAAPIPPLEDTVQHLVYDALRKLLGNGSSHPHQPR